MAEIKPHANLNDEDAGILAKSIADSDIAYILSLGVLKQYRRNGIATLLLDSLLRHLTTPERKRVKAVFLHVLTTNSAAIMFYERRKYENKKILYFFPMVNFSAYIYYIILKGLREILLTTYTQKYISLRKYFFKIT